MKTVHQILLERLEQRRATVGIVGLGYVGLPLALAFRESGFAVVGIDIDPVKVEKLSARESYISHIPSVRLGELLSDKFVATTDFARARECDALIICVPTPLNAYREPDLSYVTGTLDSLLPYLKAGQLMSLESTTYPGTTEEELLPHIERRGFKVGQDFFLVYSPEREDPGNTQFRTQSIPKVCGGVTPQCLAAGVALYQGVIDRVVPVSSTRTAELTKLLENIHRSVNIGLMNELKVVAHKMGIDIYEVIRAASTKPFGFTPYYPGPGIGGHCIPIDPFYLTWKAREYGLHTRFIELSGEINGGMPAYVVGQLFEALNERGRAVKGAKIHILGLAYKKNIDDVRESPSIEIMEQLMARGATVSYSDPHVPKFPRMRKHYFELSSEALSEAFVKSVDAVVIATDHDAFDFEWLAQHAALILDTRGVYATPRANVVKG